jgi:putative hydrolase of the HAD superfamily
MKKWILFDAMGVIFVTGDDTKDLLIPFIKDRKENISVELINALYISASLGEIKSSQFWNYLGLESDYINLDKQYLDEKLVLDPHVRSVLEELHKKYNLALLSNDVSEWSSYLREKYNLNQYFNVIIISGDVRHRKPSEKIYRIALGKINSSPDNCIFIDDRIKNLYPAIKLRMKTIKFNREDEFSEDYNVCDAQVNKIIDIPEVINQLLWEEAFR